MPIAFNANGPTASPASVSHLQVCFLVSPNSAPLSTPEMPNTLPVSDKKFEVEI